MSLNLGAIQQTYKVVSEEKHPAIEETMNVQVTQIAQPQVHYFIPRIPCQSPELNESKDLIKPEDQLSLSSFTPTPSPSIDLQLDPITQVKSLVKWEEPGYNFDDIVGTDTIINLYKIIHSLTKKLNLINSEIGKSLNPDSNLDDVKACLAAIEFLDLTLEPIKDMYGQPIYPRYVSNITLKIMKSLAQGYEWEKSQKAISQGGMSIVTLYTINNIPVIVKQVVTKANQIFSLSQSQSVYEKEVIGNYRVPYNKDIHIVPILSKNMKTRLLYFPYYSGGDMTSVLIQERKDSKKYNDERFYIDREKAFLDILLAIYHLHKNNLIHLDIKPDNIFLDLSDPINQKAYLGDLAFVQYEGENRRSGTPSFADPNLINEAALVTRACDIYSLGLTMYCAYSYYIFNKFPNTYEAFQYYKTKNPNLTSLPLQYDLCISDPVETERVKNVIISSIQNDSRNRPDIEAMLKILYPKEFNEFLQKNPPSPVSDRSLSTPSPFSPVRSRSRPTPSPTNNLAFSHFNNPQD